MSILGPLAIGTRVQFQIKFTIPSGYNSADGNAVITDTLPSQLSPYINNESTITDDKNAVTINSTALDRNSVPTPEFTITANNHVITVTVPAAVLAKVGYAGKQLAATIDTVLNDTITVTDSLELSNTGSVSIGSSYIDSGNVSAAFTLIPLGDSNQTRYVVNPTNVDRADNKQIIVTVYFKTSETADTKYFVDIPKSNYFSSSAPSVIPRYGDDSNVSVNSKQFNVNFAGGVVSFSNIVENVPATDPPTQDIAGKYIEITIYLRTANLAGTTPEEVSEISSSYAVSIGGAQAVPTDFTIGIN